MSFSHFGLSIEILKALKEAKYTKPTPIQTKTIPLVLQGKDITAAAQTGTGKTAGFLLPLFQILSESKGKKSNQARSLILAPTRELAIQIGENARQYSKFTSLTVAVVFGGVKINPQMMTLRKGVDILIGTPGRLLDLCSKNAIKFPELQVLVLDEADRMLDLGFIDDVHKIFSLLPKDRQTLMYSATFSKDILNLSARLLKNPVEVTVSPRNMTATTVEQWIFSVDKKLKSELLSAIICFEKWTRVLVFTNTKKSANSLAAFLNTKELEATALHGDKNQIVRAKILSEFKEGTIKILIATDIAARGLDVDQLQYVVNFDLPKVAENYIHRIGRTGRAGLSGQAISLVSADEFKYLQQIEMLIKKIIPRKIFDGFAPIHNIPKSKLTKKVQKYKKNTNKGAPLDARKIINLDRTLNLQPRKI